MYLKKESSFKKACIVRNLRNMIKYLRKTTKCKLLKIIFKGLAVDLPFHFLSMIREQKLRNKRKRKELKLRNKRKRKELLFSRQRIKRRIWIKIWKPIL